MFYCLSCIEAIIIYLICNKSFSSNWCTFSNVTVYANWYLTAAVPQDEAKDEAKQQPEAPQEGDNQEKNVDEVDAAEEPKNDDAEPSDEQAAEQKGEEVKPEDDGKEPQEGEQVSLRVMMQLVT